MAVSPVKIVSHLENMEGYRTTGYIVRGTRNSGITIAYGVDLSQPPYNTEQGLRNAGFSEEFISKCVELDILGKTAGQIQDEGRDPSAIAKQIKIPNTKEEKEKQGKLFIERNKKTQSKYANAMDEKTFVSYSTLSHWGGTAMTKEERDAISDPSALNALDRKAYVMGAIQDEIDGKIEQNGKITSKEYERAIYNGQNSVENFRADSPLNTDTLNRERAFAGDVDNYMNVEVRNEYISQQDILYEKKETTLKPLSELTNEEYEALSNEERKAYGLTPEVKIKGGKKTETLTIPSLDIETIPVDLKEELELATPLKITGPAEKILNKAIKDGTITEEQANAIIGTGLGGTINLKDVKQALTKAEVEVEEEGITIPDPNVSIQDNIDLQSTNVDALETRDIQVRAADLIDNGDGTYTRTNEDGTQEIVTQGLDAEGNSILVPVGPGTPIPEESVLTDIPEHPSTDLDLDNDNIPDVIDPIQNEGFEKENPIIGTPKVNDAIEGRYYRNEAAGITYQFKDGKYVDVAPAAAEEDVSEAEFIGPAEDTRIDYDGDGIPDDGPVALPDTSPSQRQTFQNALSGAGNIGASLLKGAGAALDAIGGPGAIISYIMGKKGLKAAMKEIEPQASAELSPMFMQHLRQTRELAKKGFHPDEAKAIRKQIGHAYQLGLENAVRGSGGQRAKFLAQSGVLDANRSSALLAYAVKDEEIQRKNAGAYEKMMLFKENFDINKTQAERAEDMARQVADKKAAAGFTSAAFTSLMNSYGSGKNSALMNQAMNMYKDGQGTSQLFNSIQNWGNQNNTNETTSEKE